jgi:uncharacterized membrane protein YfcA
MIFVFPPFGTTALVFSLFVVLVAGTVRGFAGFGFLAVTLAGLSLVVSPVRVVPAIFTLEILASLSQLRGIARDIDLAWLIDWHWATTCSYRSVLACWPGYPKRHCAF